MRTSVRRAAAAVLGAAALALGAYAIPAAHAQQTGLHIEGTQVVEGDGSPFVMRGINHPYAWYTDENQSFAEIDSLGANTVRVVLGSGQQWGPTSQAEVAEVVAQCKQNQLICVLEVHDTTGYGEDGAAASLEQAVDYWASVQDALTGEEDYVVINIGNEPIGNNNAQQWTQATVNAVERMRAEGFEHLLMVDAPNWGQDWEQIMLADAHKVAAADPTGNTLFSIHMYGVYEQAQAVTDYLDQFEQHGLAYAIGEFGYQEIEGGPHTDTIMAEAESRGLGYLGWSYSGNTDPALDMVVDFDVNQLTGWGERIVDGPNGLSETAQKASIFQ